MASAPGDAPPQDWPFATSAFTRKQKSSCQHFPCPRSGPCASSSTGRRTVFRSGRVILLTSLGVLTPPSVAHGWASLHPTTRKIGISNLSKPDKSGTMGRHRLDIIRRQGRRSHDATSRIDGCAGFDRGDASVRRNGAGASGNLHRTTNPHGHTVPPAGSTTLPGPNGGQNEDGFYPTPRTPGSTSSSRTWEAGRSSARSPVGRRSSTRRPRVGTPSSKKIGSTNGQAGAVQYHITGTGDAFVFPTGEPQHGVSCLVPPPPK